MRTILNKLTVSGVAICGALALATSSHAQGSAGVNVGVLSCSESSGWGFIFGSSREVKCVFSTSGNQSERYAGQISKFGIDIGYQRAAVLVWTVLAPTTDVAPGALSGAYGGVTAGAAVAVGPSANVLIGGSTKSIVLQPVSVGGSSGLNVAAGIAALTLDSQP